MHHYNYITIDYHDSAQLNIALAQALAIALEHQQFKLCQFL